MSMKSSVEIFTEPTGSQFSHRELQSTEISNKYTHHDEDIVDSSSSSSYPVQDAPFDIDKPSPDARSRATLFLEKYNAQHRDGESNDEQSCPSSLPSSTPSESVRLSNVVNCNSWSETTPDQKRADEDEIKQVTVYCHHVPSNESGQSRNANTSGAITRTFEDAMPPDTWENKGIPNIRLSLRGGGSDTIWAQPKDKQRGRPTLSYRGGGGHAALKANGTNKLQRPVNATNGDVPLSTILTPPPHRIREPPSQRNDAVHGGVCAVPGWIERQPPLARLSLRGWGEGGEPAARWPAGNMVGADAYRMGVSDS